MTWLINPTNIRPSSAGEHLLLLEKDPASGSGLLSFNRQLRGLKGWPGRLVRRRRDRMNNCATNGISYLQLQAVHSDGSWTYRVKLLTPGNYGAITHESANRRMRSVQPTELFHRMLTSPTARSVTSFRNHLFPVDPRVPRFNNSAILTSY